MGKIHEGVEQESHSRRNGNDPQVDRVIQRNEDHKIMSVLDGVDFQNSITIHRLQADMFDVADFRCSNPNYEKYLKDEAFKEQKASIAQTWVFVLKKKNVVGYVSLAMGNVTKTKHTKLSTLPHTDVPGILLGRLATHVTYERMGVGTYMISWVFSEAKRQSADIGCRSAYLNKALILAITPSLTARRAHPRPYFGATRL